MRHIVESEESGVSTVVDGRSDYAAEGLNYLFSSWEWYRQSCGDIYVEDCSMDYDVFDVVLTENIWRYLRFVNALN